jgi:hypothetical protein
MISHPTEGREQGILERVLALFEQRALVLYDHWERSTYSDDDMMKETVGKGTYLKSTLDNYEKWIGVLRIDKNIATTSGGCASQSDAVPATDCCSAPEPRKLIIT